MDHGQFGAQEETEFATGCCMAASKKTIEQVGFLDDKYFFGLEDLDWSVRMSRKGYKIMYQPASVIWHKNASSSGGSGSEMHQYYQNRNRLLFGWRYASLKTKMALVKDGIMKLSTGNQAEKRAVKDALLNRYGKQHEK